MANENQVTLLKQGSEVWNAWRQQNPRIEISLWFDDLSGADLSGADLSNAYFSNTNLSNTNLSNANLSNANLSNANLGHANLSNANLSNTSLSSADLNNTNLNDAALSYAALNEANFSNAILSNVDLSYADLSHANLSKASLSKAYLINANLSHANLSNADLSNANLSNADLSNANLNASQILHANLTQTRLTGACIADWQIGSSTVLEDVKCDYIFRTYDQQTGQFSSRLPIAPESTFASGEFTQRFQIIASALETIDITLTEGIDWQAFFQSFQDLRTSCPDEDISIQGMESKGSAFVVRLEVSAEADRAAIETEIKQRYAYQLAALEAQYEQKLRLQGAHLGDIRDFLSFERQERTRLSKVVETMANEQKAPKYDMRGAQFAGGFAETIQVQGNNVGGIINNYGQNADDVVRLLTSLRQLSEAFPEEQKADVLMELDDLESDLSKPEKQEPKRIGKRLQRLMAAGTAAATLVGGAATFSGNVNEFTENVFELGERIGLTREVMQP
ncbi:MULTISPECIES: pentapeptide repeat-containing protein [Cyanophyceae]|uniref:Pentapeptide repeat-containing protein n=1 Tax=Leptolyngbya subtilissima DQ-A4 TaxID=2933933 RepID=A0ABV0K1E3_9CYAN|nr:pentapeptide repeat-containing protein [Nodosilinea sp. FACHB-141]MBD2111264.1 pentapeptide repeat-containing protein [Nodosilinea sp. FACHB-141]